MARKKTNAEIAHILREFELIDQAKGIAFKPQAYEGAAQTVESLKEQLAVIYKRGGLAAIDALPGIGESIAKKIEKLVTSGTLPEYQKLKKAYPFDIVGMTAVEGFGPKKALALYKALGIKTLPALEKAARQGKIATVPGFGKASQQKILEGIVLLRKTGDRKTLAVASKRAEKILKAMRKSKTVERIDVCGSVRRKKETVGDLDFICTTTTPKQAIQAFKKLPDVVKVFEEGPNRIFVRFGFNMDGDLLVLKPEEYGSALLHFTGNKEHNIELRNLAKKKGMKLSEFGLFKGKKRIAAETEEEIYRALGLKWIPPEERLGRGEIAQAMK